MEALTGVAAGLLCALDMVKSFEKNEDGQYPETSISDIVVLEKHKAD
jgi:cyclic pyranopterin phosphate synthase